MKSSTKKTFIKDPKSSKVLIICGPTATGKTDLALRLAHIIDGELISADSRQVFKGMDIGTGKDIPSGFIPKSSSLEFNHHPIIYFTDGFKRIWGYDLVNPDQDFSVSHFVKLAHQLITHIQERGRLPIVVGGTGMYLKSLQTPPATLMITPDNQLRTRLSRLSVIQLQSKLRKINLLKLQSMTHSDQLNPRRLIRAIEVTRSLQHSSTAINFPSPNYKWIGLTAPTSILEDKIESRVISRLTPAFLKEVRYLMTQFPNWNAPAFTSTGYSFTREYILRKLSHDQVLKKWTLSEKQYAKRQLTWFKKQPHITWFQINTPSWLDQVVQEVKNWYATKDAETAPKN